ncbi:MULTISPECIES: hypoxanthine phosphoribosyltransferase [unclassified Bdellovibrio]|jgi:hypoxanthine phosphoribosyltransferase|uniref:hypoxanthine phosphoribosyltransferase n=1 Tax=unclassified Bdellovibrio TaxID=2633795 RepID=UPI0011583391|nr:MULTISPECIES: hypoxanthine phosphoribosyltransferase [unclassified Bdellovibrio]QDK44218.1 hypoxanthine phosphoribosyltransferase [Bdellovibrio sp. ZAP7]QLY26045.1 hypoxanthine phosphoribosyltransferase [Bdellovibrio sp. KM01]
MTNLTLKPYISEEKIQLKVKELGEILTKQFKNEKVIAICVLKGSFMFYSDLIRSINADITCEFFGVASYHGGTSSSGEVKVTLDLASPIENQHVILVEDIVDTGLTMNYLKNSIMSRKPKSLTTIALLEKPDALKVKCDVDHVGFKIPNDFVVGYGLDYQGYYRNLPYIAQVQNFQ